jgi:hypothetical protein
VYHRRRFPLPKLHWPDAFGDRTLKTEIVTKQGGAVKFRKNQKTYTAPFTSYTCRQNKLFIIN